MKRFLLIIAATLLAAGAVSAQEAKRQVTRITDDVYRFQNNFHVNMFVLTGAGVIVTDPINAEAAGWLKAEIGKLTSQPITHLVYSHSHGDHASGGRAYGKVPNVVMQSNAPDDIDGVNATLRFSDELSIALGSKTLELSYLGPGHGDDLVAMVVRPDNVAFVVDAVSAKRLFYRDFGGANVDDWIDQVRDINSLDFDILIGGHGPLGDRADVAAGLVYLEKLRAEVLSRLQAGKSVEQIVNEVTMDEYQQWQSFDQWRALNVSGMARHLLESGAVK